MQPTRVLAVLVSVAAGLLPGTRVMSEDSPSPVSPNAAPTTAPAAVEKPPANSPPRRGSKRERRPKEVEGAKALNRFEAETGFKSRYHINGKQLEVDPD